MPTPTVILIVLVAVAAIALLTMLTWLARNRRNEDLRAQADTIRDEARRDTLQVNEQDALADETAARARAAQAEADVKAAQASGLQQQAAARRGEAATSRSQVNEEWDRADTMDPAANRPKTPRSASKS